MLKPRGYPCHPHTELGVGTGGAKASHDTLRETHTLVFICPICLSLVNFLTAIQAAGKGGLIHAGAGCGANHGGKRVAKARLAQRQTERARGLWKGTLQLVRPPTGQRTHEAIPALVAEDRSVVEHVITHILGTQITLEP